ncbi:MAG: methylated-DNA--[protein]-cysteine S-methyltransferase [Deltaproteobacteria bacterium]|nr:methylated-DNA--[protein]-cysteine S-methyltransferase [Deltaproteobacteria bacterium]
MRLRHHVLASPLGELLGVVTDEGAVRSLLFVERDGADRALEALGQAGNDLQHDQAALANLAGQLAAYFDGRQRSFDLALAPEGTEFERRVWAELVRIPYGETRSYRDVAVAVGAAGAERAVGRANGRNPVAIIIPCHRVVGADGKLVGYAGGLWRKEHLLQLEGALKQRALFPSWTP